VKRFSPSVSDNPALNRVQSNLEESLGFLRDKEIISGRLVTVNVAASTTVVVGHGLGQKFKGYFPVKIRKQDGTPRSFDYMVEQQSTDESLYFSLSVLGSDELTVSFWIF
jgi:hypothetical protein|tara:strand:+ start:8430 stop:8759 length:330 start_codon:yes stop_codon:yes gene_type:complete